MDGHSSPVAAYVASTTGMVIVNVTHNVTLKGQAGGGSGGVELTESATVVDIFEQCLSEFSSGRRRNGR